MIDRKAYSLAQMTALGRLSASEKVELPAILKAMLDVQLDAIDCCLDALKAEGASAKAMPFKGSFDASVAYAQGDVVLRSGIAWVCLAGGDGTPGISDGWVALGS